jgi:guanylate kinase
MTNNSRIILCGGSASGKTLLKNRMKKKGLKFSISYTTRPMRDGEVDGIDYNFLTEEEFDKREREGFFYETALYSGYLYGQGIKEWNEDDLFVMEPVGISKITPEDRKSSFIIFIDAEERVRVQRLRERGSSPEEIKKRIIRDREAFKDFYDYDLIIRDPNF